MQYYLLILLLIFSFFSRFYLLDKIPPSLASYVLALRLTTAVLSVASIFLLFLYSKRITKKPKIALFSAWIIAVLPWTIEQSRIYSQVSIALFLLLLFLLAFDLIKNIFLKLSVIILFCVLFYIAYPDFWLFKSKVFFDTHTGYLNNLFSLLSPEFLFFRNFTFYWGGVKEAGVMYLIFLPFLIIGLVESFIYKQFRLLIPILMILIISSSSPFFPESREFFLIIPFLSIIMGLGVYKLLSRKLSIILLLLFTTLIVYEMGQFFHYYYIHYPQDIISNKPNIKQPF